MAESDPRRRRWTDFALDRELGSLRARVDNLNGTRERLVAIEQKMSQVDNDLRELNAGVHEITEMIRQRDHDDAIARVEQARERRAARRWLVGTMLATGTLLVAAAAVMVSVFG